MKLICFDLDGTLSKESSRLKLNTALGMTPERDEELFLMYTAGNISYEQWQESIVTSYVHDDISHKEIVDSLFKNPEFIDGAAGIVKDLQNSGHVVVLISGSFGAYVSKAAHFLGIEDYRACSELIFDADGYVTKVEHSGDEHTAKLTYLKELAQKYNTPIEECICIGDGPNDLDMFRATGKGITFTGSPIENDAWKVVGSLGDVVNSV